MKSIINCTCRSLLLDGGPFSDGDHYLCDTDKGKTQLAQSAASALNGLRQYASSHGNAELASAYCTYSRRVGQAELAWVNSYVDVRNATPPPPLGKYC